MAFAGGVIAWSLMLTIPLSSWVVISKLGAKLNAMVKLALYTVSSGSRMYSRSALLMR